MTNVIDIVYFLTCLLAPTTIFAMNTCSSLDLPSICECHDINQEITVRCKSNKTDIFDFNSGFINHINHLHVVGDTSLFTFAEINCMFNCSYLNLKTLDVEGNLRDIEIHHSHMIAFSNLEILRLHHCNIWNISKGAFKALFVLKVFEISGNGLLAFESIEAGLEGLKAPDMEIFNISGNQNEISMPFATVTKSFFMKLSHTSLKVMDFSWTLIFSIESTFQRLPHLEVLILTGTPILGERNCLLSLLALENLTTLIWDTWPNIPRGYKTIRVLPESANRFKRGIAIECGLGNYVSNKGCIIPPQKLKTIQQRNANMDSSFLEAHTGVCVETNNILNLIVSGGQIKKPYGPIVGFRKLKLFDIGFPEVSSNTESFQPYNAFYDIPSVEILLVGGNQLNKLLLDQLSVMFSKNPRLRVLDISKNGLLTLPSQMFVNNIFLESLNVSFNKLEIFNLDFKHNINLKVIYLQHNNLKTIDVNVIRTLNGIEYGVNIFLTNNEFECECSLLDFFKADHINTSFYCSSNKQQVLIETNSTVLDRSSFYCDINTTTNITLAIGLSASGAILTIICVILAFILKRRRDEIRRKLKENESSNTVLNDITLITLPSVSNRDTNNERKFVAFLAYSYTDTNFVFKNLYHKLCEQLTARLPDRNPDSLILVHDKHFLPGSDIDEIIESAINDSYVTIAIISDSFLDSYWCHFEIKMAQISNVPIIPLYLKECDPNKFKGELKVMYHKKVRLLWPLESSHDNASHLCEEENKIVDTLSASVLTYMKRCTQQKHDKI